MDKFVASLPAGQSEATITHTLNTWDVVVSAYDYTKGKTLHVTIRILSPTTLVVSADYLVYDPITGQLMVVVERPTFPESASVVIVG